MKKINTALPARQYWLKKLSGFDYNNLSVYGMSLPDATCAYETYIIKDGRLSLPLDKIAPTERSKQLMLLTTVVILLQKLTFTADVVIFTPLPEGLTGVMPIRVGDVSSFNFKTLLSNVKDEFIQDLKYTRLPMEDILNMDPTHIRTLPAIGVLVNGEQLASSWGEVNPRLLFQFTTGDQLTLTIKYDANGFEASYIRRMAAAYIRLLSCLMEDADCLIKDVSIINSSVPDEDLSLFPKRFINYPKNETLVSLFRKQASLDFSKIAITCGGSSLTYGALDTLSTRVAIQLKKRGLKGNGIVGLITDRSIETIVGMLAILKAGGAYLPIDTDYPQERIAYLLKDSGLNILLASKAFKAGTIGGIQALYVEDLQIETDEPDISEAFSSDPSDLCYVIYTSGTTGNPKGVMVEHRNVVRLLFNEEFQFDFGTDDVWTMFHSHCFDFSVWEIYGALLYGGKLVIIPKSVARDTAQFLQVIKEEKVTVLNQTPSAFYNLIQEDANNEPPIDKLRYVIFGGESLAPEKLKSWQEKYPAIRLINMYGITETTVHVTFKEITTLEIKNCVSNIGRPIPTLSVYVFNRDQQIVPRGGIGELYVGGEGVSRGYLGKDALTRDRFINNLVPGERLYKSGDLVKVLESGDMEYIGRMDNQVQLKGFRIELGEIEHQLSTYSQIKEVIVMVWERGDTKHLVAYYKALGSINDAELRRYLSGRLPDYMIPAYYVHLEKTPLTHNGKIDKAALPTPVLSSENDYAVPASDLEKQLCEIWSKVLKRSAVGVNDNFFTTGGDSILAVRLLGLINYTFKRELSLQNLFDHDTIKGLANYMVTAQEHYDRTVHNSVVGRVHEFGADYLDRYPDDTVAEVYPMSDIEKGMCFVSLQNPSDVLYIEQNFHQVPYRDFKFDIFKKAAWLLANKHAALRTAYDLDNFAHIVYKDPKLNIAFLDLSTMGRPQQKRIIEEAVQKIRTDHFHLNVAPLWRIDIYGLAADDFLMVFTGHHAILDGWSYASFINELNDIYISLQRDQNFKPSGLQSTYKDFIILEGEEKERGEAKDFWKKELSGYKRLDFGVKSDTKAFRMIDKTYPAALSHQLGLVAQRTGIPVKHLLFGAYVYALKMLTYEDDLTVGLVSFKRPLTRDGDKILGCFLNTVPVRVKIGSGTTWNTFIHAVDHKLSEVRMYDGLSLFEISQAAGESSQNSHPFFDTFFNFINFHIANQFNVMEPASEEADAMGFDNFIREGTFFNISMHVNEQGINAKYDYVTNFMDDALFDKFLTYYERFIDELGNRIPNGDGDVEINLLTCEEKDQLLGIANTSQRIQSPGTSVVDLFEDTIGRYGKRQAVICGDEILTYIELNRRANQLAHCLISKGIKQEDRIGIYLERSVEMIVSMLAILKAGAAYLPLDTEYPSDRIRKIVDDASPRLVVTDQSTTFRNIVNDEVTSLDVVLEHEYLEKMPIHNPGLTLSECQAAYVIYTSGSTGTPKGVLIEHLSLLDYCLVFKEYLSVTAEDKVIQQASLSFDTAVEEIFPTLISGACLIVVQSKGRDIERLLDAVQNNQATILSTVPVVLNELNKHVERLDSLRAVISGGDVLLPLHVDNLLGRVAVYNSYGPTESTVCVTYNEIEKIEDVSLLGQPLRNRRVYIVDRNLRLQPAGIPGELCVSGTGLAREYVGNIALTRERFVDNPFQAGERMYRTGDLARWRADGRLEFFGRIDDQIKIRGNRIEPGEIEHVLLGLDGIQQVAVIAKEKNGQKYLIAFIQSDPLYASAEIRKFLVGKLPEYMIPQYFVGLENLPLTPSSKVDTKALHDYKIGWHQDYVPPTTDIEKVLVHLWQIILNKERIGIEDNFFQSGGNSLNVITLKNRISKMLQADIPVKEIFERPTPKLLGDYIGIHAWLNRETTATGKKTTSISI